MKNRSTTSRKWGAAIAMHASLLVSFALLSPLTARAQARTVALAQHVPNIVKRSKLTGRANKDQILSLAITLPLRNSEDLDVFLRKVYDPRDMMFGQYLTPEEFAANYSPAQEEYDEVVAFAKAQGLEVTGASPNRLLLDVRGAASTVEKAFGVRINTYQAPNGRVFHSNDGNPVIPANLADKISGVVGMSDYAVRHPHNKIRPANAFNNFGLHPNGGTGPGGGFAPIDIATAYALKGVAANGAGQTLALFELDGYTPSDVTSYENNFNLPKMPLKNILLDGFDGSAGGGAGEVTLDIELMIAMAPGATGILVYEAPNSEAGVLDTYNKIATDNLAKQISTSWGLAEDYTSTTTFSSQSAAFKQMAAQGQSIYAAAGDSGAYDDGANLTVDDPASQPYMTGVGGTTLTTSSSGAYVSETTWSDIYGDGGGGGISSVWPIPSYQAGIISAASKGSTTMRNVPDVSLNADPNTGYSIFVFGGWNVYGGTSCAAPLWAAYTARVNQEKAVVGLQPLGFANPSLYNIGKGTNYKTDFHDIADGSTNLYYPAVKGYDDATGWGTFIGANLLNDLVGVSSIAAPTALKASAASAGAIKLTWTAAKGAITYNVYRSVTSGTEALYATKVATNAYTDNAAVPGTTYYYKVTGVNGSVESAFSNEASVAPTGTVTAQLILNPGFENGLKTAPWSATGGVITNEAGEPSHSGKWKAWLGGYGFAHTDTLAQTVTIPVSAKAAALSFWLHIDSTEPINRGAKDVLTLQILDNTGKLLGTIGTYSNLNAMGGYSLQVYDMQAYLGKTIQILFTSSENATNPTSFVMDDFSLNTL